MAVVTRILTLFAAGLLAWSLSFILLVSFARANSSTDSASDPAADQVQYLYLAGVAALERGEIYPAILAFESVLLSAPWHIGAQIDLAIAYCRSGEEAVCSAHLDALVQVLGHKPLIRALVDQLRPSSWRHQTQLDVGHSDNLNKGIGHRSLDLLIQNIPVTLWLNAQSQQQAGRFMDVSHRTDWVQKHQGSGWRAFADVFVRQADDRDAPVVQWVQAGGRYLWSIGQDSQQLALGVRLNHLTVLGQSYLGVGITLEHQWRRIAWQPRVMLVYEQRYDDRLPEPAHTYQLQTSLSPLSDVQVSLGWVEDSRAHRPEGRVSRMQVGIEWTPMLSSGVRLLLGVHHLRSADSSPYAPPLVDVARATQQWYWQAAVQGAWGQGNYWRCGAQKSVQAANHPLFNWQETVLQCGVGVVY